MEEFLKTVARHYKNKSCSEAQLHHELPSLPLSRCLFCFPNRRSSLFFARHLEEAFGGPCCVPAVTTISELFGLFSTRHVIDRTALLFRLFQVYDRLSRRRDRETFDQFVFWGDMLLSDFDDVDKYMVGADQVFRNVRELKEIDEEFAGFTPEQIRVIRSFWTSFQPERSYAEGDKHAVFGQTWAILDELYHTFRDELSRDNLAYEGMMEREVVERLKARIEAGETASGDPFEGLLRYDRVVFVGLTAVSEVDRRLMQLLRLYGHAEFCWDYADPNLQHEHSRATSAAFFTRSNLRDFGNELTDEELQPGLVPEAEREVSLYSVSSGVGQAQQARRILLDWSNSVPGFDPFRTAVVLPDENLLLPMLYAVPRAFDSFNVTMGYSLRTTPVAAFVQKLAQLQQAWRERERTFYFRQVLPLLSHSFTLGMTGRTARQLSARINDGNLYQVPQSLFADDAFLSRVFRPLRTATETLDYLLELLNLLMKRAARDIELGKSDEPPSDDNGQYELFSDLDEEVDDAASDGGGEASTWSPIDYEFLYHYRKVVLQLQSEVSRQVFSFTPRTLFQLLDRLVAGVSVPFSGEPLRGLQIMGVLETRALDFDNVIILSMNEGTFPAKPVQNTFVPMSLRDAFGMPTQRHRDSVFAYHFYRLISRARRVAMIYDSRTGVMQSGEESRYVKQLRFLMGHHEALKPRTQSDPIRIVSPSGFAVPKTPEVMAQLRQCLATEGKRNISASVLKYYIQCPLKFYLSFVRQLYEDDEVTEGVDSKKFGDILHRALELLYSQCEGRRVESSMLDRYIKHPEREITQCIRQAFDDKMGIAEPEGYNLLIVKILTSYVVETLRHDQQFCPFEYLAGEQQQHFEFQAAPDLRVRIKAIYDRVDCPLSGGTDSVRIVDYKTGSSGSKSKGEKLVFDTVDDLFRPQGKGSSEAFQVMLYSLLLEHAQPDDLRDFHLTAAPAHVEPNLYFVRDLHAGIPTCTRLTMAGAELTDFSVCHDEFLARLQQLFVEIFNPDIPFGQCQDTWTCKNCPFKNLCKRI